MTEFNSQLHKGKKEIQQKNHKRMRQFSICFSEFYEAALCIKCITNNQNLFIKSNKEFGLRHLYSVKNKWGCNSQNPTATNQHPWSGRTLNRRKEGADFSFE